MSVERKPSNENLHPEGLTGAQERLADLLFDTKTQAKVRRRIPLTDGGFKFEVVVRDTSPIDFAQEGEFALKLHEEHPEAPLSPIYINLRNLPADVLGQVGRAMTETPTLETPDFCTGIPTAGEAIAEVYASYSGMERIDILEKEEKESGRRIVPKKGVTPRKGRLRLIDDLVTRADTKIEAIKAVESLGFQVTDIVILVDREQGGKQQLAEAGYNLQAVFTLKQLLNYYLRVDRITQDVYQNTIQGLEALNNFLGL